MEIEQLLKLESSKVRNDKALLLFYIEAFYQKFGYKPSCAGCTFSTDWNKLKNAFKNNYKITDMKDKTFKLKDTQKIYTYYNGKRPVRTYGNSMTEEFAVNYLTIGTEEQIELRKLEFKVLPNLEVSETEKENETETEKAISFKQLKEMYPQFADAKNKKELLEFVEAEVTKETTEETTDIIE